MSTVLSTAKESFASLKSAPRELWFVFVLKFLESFAYFSMSLILLPYLNEYGYSDSQAGWIYGIFGTFISVYGVLIGFVIDNLGVRKSLIIGSALLLVARIVLALTTSKSTILFVLYTILPFGMSLGIPVMSTGIRRYTNSSNRSFGFSLFYAVMNIAALFCGWIVDILRMTIANQSIEATCGESTTHSGIGAYRSILLLGASATAAQLLICVCCVREIELNEAGTTEEFQVQKEAPTSIIWNIIREKKFWRYLLFIVLLIGVKTVFRHMDATLPKYLLRKHGCNVAFGAIYSINPFLIIFLVPLFTALTLQHDLFNQILLGSAVSSMSVFFMAVTEEIWGAVFFMIFLSIGEALWSPRLYQYSAMIAPKGREGTYMALSTAPFFVAKFFIGGLSGVLLQNYCVCMKSECEPCCTNTAATTCERGTYMWFLIALMSISSPILIFIFRNVIRGNEQRSTTIDVASLSTPDSSIELVGLNRRSSSGPPD